MDMYGKWTSVKEAMPTKAGFYLVTRRYYTWNNELYFATCTEYFDKVNGRFKDDKTITAWMSLPAPYKDTDDDSAMWVRGADGYYCSRCYFSPRSTALMTHCPKCNVFMKGVKQ